MTTTSKRILRTLGWLIGIIIAFLIILVIYIQVKWDAKQDRYAPALTAPRDHATVARGEYIFKYQAHCWSCHADGASDAHSAPSGGKPFDLTRTGPGFGMWYTPNITPDMETGIGAWTDGEIVQAIREGVRKDRRALFPLMPVDWYHGISDGDALAIVAYLRSLPPVSNRVQQHTPSFFAKALFAFGVIKPKEAITQPVAAPPPRRTVAYGKYLAENLSGCIDCHTPRNLENGRFFSDSLGAGSTIDFGGPEGDPIVAYARNITPDMETGIGDWNEEQFLTAVTAGMRPDGIVLDPHMPYAYYKSCNEDDLIAIYLYLRSLPPIKRGTPAIQYSRELSQARGIDRGRLIFVGRCQSCHGVNGAGAQPTAVSLAEVASSIDDTDLRQFIKEGSLNLKMPAFDKTLREDEMNDLIAFIRTWKMQ
jgi:mono/diheme cytochrome c family protein